MLLVNKKPLPALAKGADKSHELYEYVEEYKKGLKFFNDEFPRGAIKLNRSGYPRKSRDKKNKPVPPFGMPLEWMAENMNGSGSALWSYCAGTPIVHPNGLCDIRENKMWLNGADWALDWKKDPDLAFYVYFKTNLVKSGMYKVKDPEKEAIRRAQERKSKHELASAIYDGLTDENKLRVVAASWDVDGAYKDVVVIVQEKLEKKVIEQHEKKAKDPNNPALRGIPEFLEDVKGGDEIRRKALIRYAIDEERIVFDKFSGKFKWKDGRDIVFVDPRYLDNKAQFLAAYLSHPTNLTTWRGFVSSLLDEELLNKQDKRGLYWIAEQLGLEDKKRSIEELRSELSALIVV